MLILIHPRVSATQWESISFESKNLVLPSHLYTGGSSSPSTSMGHKEHRELPETSEHKCKVKSAIDFGSSAPLGDSLLPPPFSVHLTQKTQEMLHFILI